MNIEQLTQEASHQVRRIQALVEAGHMSTIDGELLLSKITVLCTEIAFLQREAMLEVDEKIAVEEKARKLQAVLKICKDS